MDRRRVNSEACAMSCLRCLIVALLFAGPAWAQNPCQPLQGTAAHATCLNQQLGRSIDPDPRVLEDQAAGQPLVAPGLNMSRRDGPPVPAYDPGFSDSMARRDLRLYQSTQSRARSLSGRVNRSLSPQAGTPLR